MHEYSKLNVFSVGIHNGYLCPAKSRERNAAEPAAEFWPSPPERGPTAASGFGRHSQAMEAPVGRDWPAGQGRAGQWSPAVCPSEFPIVVQKAGKSRFDLKLG
jgi:hypothetical protein